MKTILQVIEGYGPVEMGPRGWYFDRLCTALDHYAKRKVRTQGIRKLCIDFAAQEAPRDDGECLGVVHVYVDVSRAIPLPDGLHFQQAMRALFPYLEYALHMFIEKYPCDGAALLAAAARMAQMDFDFQGRVLHQKAGGLSAELKWNLQEAIHYFLEIETKEKSCHFDILTKRLRIIDHKKIFKKMRLQPDGTVVIESAMNSGLNWVVGGAENKMAVRYKEAANGNPKDQYDLARMFLNGHILAKDPDQGLLWLEKAARQHYPEAIRLLKKLRG